MKNISDKDTFEKREEKKLFIETYGCQMNVADSEVVASIMQMAGYTLCDTIEDSDAIFVNTCSIRDNAEQKVLSRLSYFQSLRKHKKSLVIGVLGCMAERVREQLITENGVDLVVGPDSYLDLPNLVGAAERGEKSRECGAFHDRDLSGGYTFPVSVITVFRDSFRLCEGAIIFAPIV